MAFIRPAFLILLHDGLLLLPMYYYAHFLFLLMGRRTITSIIGLISTNNIT